MSSASSGSSADGPRSCLSLSASGEGRASGALRRPTIPLAKGRAEHVRVSD
jgi:hypothetical protein